MTKRLTSPSPRLAVKQPIDNQAVIFALTERSQSAVVYATEHHRKYVCHGSVLLKASDLDVAYSWSLRCEVQTVVIMPNREDRYCFRRTMLQERESAATPAGSEVTRGFRASR